jgi:hypothetical protein
VLRPVDHDGGGVGQAPVVAGHHVPRAQQGGVALQANHLHALRAAAVELELAEGQDHPLAAGHARRLGDEVAVLVVDGRREVEVLVPRPGDPQIGVRVVDEGGGVLHEAEVEADLHQHQPHAHRDARRSDHELDAVVQEDLTGQGPHRRSR